MEEEVLVCVSKLFPLLHSTCKAINLTYHVLDANCYDHQDVLKRWVLPVKEVSYECTCKPCFDEPDDMENDIQCAVERAKATRKITMQVKDMQLKKSGLVNSPSENLDNTSFKDIQKGKACDLKNRKMEKDQMKSRGSKSRIDEKERSKMENQSKLSVNVKINKPNSFRTTYQKDFSVRNPQRTSQIVKNGMKNSVNKDGTVMGIKVDNAVKIVDVDSLLDKVSTSIHRSCSDMEKKFVQKVESDICFLHGEGLLPIVHRCVNLSEAMNLYGIPSGLVKILKTYHQYINFTEKLLSRRKCSKESFLHKLNESNQCSWHHAASEPVIQLCIHYLLVFADIIPEKKIEMSGVNLKVLEEELNFLIQSYNKILDSNILLDNEEPVRNKSESVSSEDDAKKCNWALAGIWNRKCWSMFSGFKSMLKISYSSKEDCLSFHKKIQNIQKLHLQIEIIKFLKNVFPLLSNLQDNHVALAHLYKSCVALCNISTVSVPVLLKTRFGTKKK